MGCLPYFRNLNDRTFPAKEPRCDLEFWKWVLMIAFRPLTRFSTRPEARRRSTPAPAPEYIGHEDSHWAETDEHKLCVNEGRMPVDDLLINGGSRREMFAPQARASSGKGTK